MLNWSNANYVRSQGNQDTLELPATGSIVATYGPRPNSITLLPVLDPKAFDVADVVTGREHVAMLGRGGMAIRHAEPEKKKSPEEPSSPELLPVGLTGFEPATSTPPV